jgi:hypothetical protein
MVVALRLFDRLRVPFRVKPYRVQQGEPLSPLLFCCGIQGVSEAITKVCPQVMQQWYLDDGLLCGTEEQLVQCLAAIEDPLRERHLQLNLKKCELYGDSCPQHTAFQGMKMVIDRCQWTYLGAPISGNPGVSPCAQAAVEKVQAVSAAVDDFGAAHPAQALRILRHCLGACRITHLCQASFAEPLRKDVISPTSEMLRSSFSKLLGIAVTPQIWSQATLPSELGGLGLQDPCDSAEAARLANVVGIRDQVVSLGVPVSACEAAAVAALDAYNGRWSFERGLPKPEKDLQHSLTRAVLQRRRDVLVVDPACMERMTSLCSPGATKWAVQSSPWFALPVAEYRAALRWIVGAPIHSKEYVCPDCGKMADQLGVHAVTCQATGATPRGHSTVKFLLGSLFRAAGCHVEFERGPAAATTRPADILVHGAGPRPLAVDTSIWTHVRDELDAVVARKVASSKAVCAREGWQFAVWAADTWGGLHPTARRLITRLIKMLQARFDCQPAAQIANDVWSAVTAAVVSRAAGQFRRHLEALPTVAPNVEQPHEEPEDGIMEMDDEQVVAPGVLGIDSVQPDPGYPASNSVGNAAERPPVDSSVVSAEPAASGQGSSSGTEPRALSLLIKTLNGSVLPVRTTPEAGVQALKDALRRECGLPDVAAANLGLALGHACLDEARSLSGNDVQEGDTLDMFIRSP